MSFYRGLVPGFIYQYSIYNSIVRYNNYEESYGAKIISKESNGETKKEEEINTNSTIVE